jgi:PAS domain S-box-containing protein
MDSSLVRNLIVLIAEISLGAAVLAVHAAALAPIGNLPVPWRRAVTGAVFGIAGALAVAFPVEVAPGAPISTVTACVGLAGLFGGWVGGAVAVALSAGARSLLDNPHFVVGTVRAALAMLAGMSVAYWVRRSGTTLGLRHLLVQGGLVFAAAVLGGAAGQAVSLFRLDGFWAVALPLAIVLPLSTVLLGMQHLAGLRRDELSRRLTRSEARLRGVIEHMPGAVFEMRLNPDGTPNYTFWRDAPLGFGLTGPQAVSDPTLIARHLLPEEDELRERYLRNLAATMQPGSLEYRVERPGGGTRWVRTRATPRLDEDGAVVWTGITTDITQEKRKDDDLRRFTAELGESERRFRAVLAHLPAMVFEARETPDGTYRYTFVSDGVRQFGLTPQDLLADPKRIESICFPEDEPERLRALREARETLSMREREFRVRLADGRVRWLHSRSAPQRARGGDIVWDGMVIDITARKELEETLKRSERALALGGLTDGVGQAFNALLREIGASARALAAPQPGQPDLAAHAAHIRALVERGGQLEEDLTRFFQPPAEQTDLVDVKALLEGVRRLAANFIGPDTRLHLRTSAALWPALVDASRLQICTLGLILHARDSLTHGGEIAVFARNVALSEADGAAIGRAPGAFVRIAVAGTGPGIGGDALHAALAAAPGNGVFEPGDDLRLRAVRDFAAQCGGHLSAQADPGKGALIQFLLPAKSPAPLAAQDFPHRFA